jgi:hypothetical protein
LCFRRQRLVVLDIYTIAPHTILIVPSISHLYWQGKNMSLGNLW